MIHYALISLMVSITCLANAENVSLSEQPNKVSEQSKAPEQGQTPGQGQTSEQSEASAQDQSTQTPKQNPAIETPPKDRALEAYQKEKYPSALQLLENERNDDPEVRFLRAMIYIKQNDLPKARLQLDAAEKLQLSNDDLETLHDLQDQIGEEVDVGRPYWLYLDTAGGYNNNIYQSSDNRASTEIKGASVMNLSGGTGYHFGLTQPTSFAISYTGRWEEFYQAGDMKTVTHRLQTPIYYNQTYFRISLAPFAEHASWAGDAALGSLGARLKLAYNFEDFEIGTENEYTRQSALQSNYSYLSGHLTRHHLYAGFLTYPFKHKIFAEYTTDQISDYEIGTSILPMRNTAISLGIKTEFHPVDKWHITLDYQSTTKNYTTVPRSGKRRHDQTQSAALRIAYMLVDNLEIYANQSYTLNHSNYGKTDVADKNYENFITLLGLSWDLM